jgi:dCMP deaminase
MADWHKRYLMAAELAATFSKDRRTKVGAAMYNPATRSILTLGFNGFPRGVNDEIDARHERPVKLLWTEHAERNLIYNAAREGLRTDGKGIALDWFPCADCARAIVQSGFVEMVAHAPDFDDDRWGESFKVSLAILEEGGVKIIYLPEE